MNDADLIIPRLWLGNADSAKNRAAIVQRGINVIVNCTKDIPFAAIPEVPYRYRVKIDDDLSQKEIGNMSRALRAVLPIIHFHWLRGDTILIHCAMGIQRSAIVTMAYLCQYHGFTPHEAYTRITSRRPIAFRPAINFRSSLETYMHAQLKK